jgi:lipopolysaccharide export system protein LptA
VVRVHSQSLVYSDRTRQGDFRGTVTAEQGDEAIHADDAVMFLKPAASKDDAFIRDRRKVAIRPRAVGRRGRNKVRSWIT